MKDQRKTELRVGATVLIGIVLLVWIVGWAKNISLVDKNTKFKVQFNNVSGLEVGDVVTVNGVRKGFVEDIIIKGSSVIVDISLEKGNPLPSDSKYFVTMLDLMGGKKIEIRPGNSSKLFDPSVLQKGEFQFDIPEVMNFVGNLSGDLPKIMIKIDTALSAINSFLKDDEIRSGLKNGLKNLNTLAIDFRSILAEQRTQIDKLVKNSIKLIENADSLTSSASSLIAENRDSINSSVKSFNKLLAKSDNLVAKLTDLIDETTSKKNNIGKILYDEQAYEDLKLTLKDAKELLQLIKNQLKKDGLKVDAKINLF